MSTCISSPDAVPPLPIRKDEKLARFIVEKKQVITNAARNKMGEFVKINALFPDSKHQQVSVYRIDEWAAEKIRDAGIALAEERNAELLKSRFEYCGYLTFTPADIEIVPELTVVPDEPPPDHANIIGFKYFPPNPPGVMEENVERALYFKRVMQNMMFIEKNVL